MKVRFTKAPRLPRLPLWAAAVVIFWLALVVANLWVNRLLSRETTLCMFKRLSGHPCPTCGATRGVMALAQGRIVEALTTNPMLTLIGLGIVGVVGFRLIAGKAIRVELTRNERRMAWGLAALIFVANWAFLIGAGR